MTNQLIQKKVKRISINVMEDFVLNQVVSNKVISLETALLNSLTGRNRITFDKLKGVYYNLDSIFASDIENSIVDVNKIKKLTVDVYTQGLNLLDRIKNLSLHVSANNFDILTEENKELTDELNKCTSEKLRVMIKERLDKNTKNIDLVKKYNDQVDELLCQVGLCIDSLRGISLELPELINHKSKDEFDKILLELNTRIEFAQRVKAEYIRQGI